MTVREGAVMSAHTRIMVCRNFNAMHAYIEEIVGRPVWMHEMMDKRLWDEIKQRSTADFEKIVSVQTEE